MISIHILSVLVKLLNGGVAILKFLLQGLGQIVAAWLHSPKNTLLYIYAATATVE